MKKILCSLLIVVVTATYASEGTKQAMGEFLARHEIRLELTSNEAVKQAVIAGIGCSIMPLIGIKNKLFNKDPQVIAAKGLPITTMWSLIWMKGKKHSPVGAAYLEHLAAHKDTITKK